MGNREDLEAVTTLLAPQETPVLSMATKKKATNITHDWTVDGLAAVSTAGVNEGEDVTAFNDKYAALARLSNYCQKLRRSYMVSDFQERSDSVTPARLASAEAKAAKEVKRDVEACLISTNDRQAEAGGGVPSKMRGLGDWIDSAGPSDVPAAYRTPSASLHTSGLLTETIWNNIITSMFRVTGYTNGITAVADTAARRVISDFARTSASGDYSVRNVNYEGGNGKITLSVQMYESDHGMVSIVNMNPDCAPDTTDKDTVYLINPEYYSVAEFKPLGSQRLPDLGGGPRGYVDWIGTLVVNHPGAHGLITDVTA